MVEEQISRLRSSPLDWSGLNLLAFDIETANPAPEDGNSYALGVTCIGIHMSPGVSEVRTPEFDQEKGSYNLTMNADDIRDFCHFLFRMQELGYMIVTINGTSFDFRVLAEESDSVEYYDNFADLALNHYDPTLQMLCLKGYPVGMAAMASGFSLAGKTAGMDGLSAVRMWNGGIRAEQDRVLDYVKQDARTTYLIAQKIIQESAIRWISKRGRPSCEYLEPALVHECLREGLPDMSWWKGSDRPSRFNFARWTLGPGKDGVEFALSNGFKFEELIFHG